MNDYYKLFFTWLKKEMLKAIGVAFIVSICTVCIKDFFGFNVGKVVIFTITTAIYILNLVLHFFFFERQSNFLDINKEVYCGFEVKRVMAAVTIIYGVCVGIIVPTKSIFFAYCILAVCIIILTTLDSYVARKDVYKSVKKIVISFFGVYICIVLLKIRNVLGVSDAKSVININDLLVYVVLISLYINIECLEDYEEMTDFFRNTSYSFLYEYFVIVCLPFVMVVCPVVWKLAM